MSAQLIDGKKVAKNVRKELRPRIRTLLEHGVTPGLAAILVGDDPASATYVGSKEWACQKLGLHSEIIIRPASLSQEELIAIVNDLNNDDRIHGILVQSPLPSHIDELSVTMAIRPEKDVDGFHPHNVGMLLLGRASLVPCTPLGIIKLLEFYNINPSGKEAVVVGRSNIVGKPIAALLMQKARTANATVTVAHSRSKNLPDVVRRADILIAAIGQAGTITAEIIKPGAVIIDVGINRLDDPSSPKGYRLTGDVDFEACREIASYITPVPGGVGLMTVAMLMANTVTACESLTAHRS